MRRRGAPLLPTSLLAALAALAPGCGGAERALPDVRETSRWDLLVVVLDALPASAVGCYGAPRDVTPELDRFAAGALRFENAFASASYTLTSVASVFTGATPMAHRTLGLRTNVLGREHRTLAEALREAGFRTAGISCNPHVTREAGFAQGFERFDYHARDRLDRHTVPEAARADALAWWREHGEERRFLYLHLLPPHCPYDAPPPYDGEFGAAETERREGMQEFLRELNEGTSYLREDDPAVRRIRARFDAGLSYADAVLGEILEELAAGGGLDRAVVVVLSDHGEAFGEHGRLLHGSTVFREMTRVPLIARWPGCAPGVRPGLVRTRDLAATLTALFGAPWPADGRAGEPFLAELLGPVEPAPRLALSRSVGNLPVWALRSDRWTLVMQPSSGARQLFDRRSDPGELRDVADGHAREAGVLAERLAGLLKEHRALARRLRLEGGEVRAHRESLEALGYFGDE